MGKLGGNWPSGSSDLRIKQAQEDELSAETEGWKLPPVPSPAGLSHQRQGEQVCPGSLLQRALLPLSNARVERLPRTDHFLYVLPQTTATANAVALAMPVGAAHPARGPQELGQAGQQLSPTQDDSSVPCGTAAQSHGSLVPCGSQQHSPPGALASAPVWYGHREPDFTTAKSIPQERGSSARHGPVAIKEGLVGKCSPSARPLPWLG